jgi:hypothetical protein
METHPIFEPVESPVAPDHLSAFAFDMSNPNVSAPRRFQPNRAVNPRASVVFAREDITRDGKTFSVPKKESISETSPPDAKRRFFQQTYDSINSGNGKWSTKVNAFCTRFTSGDGKYNEARNRLIPLYDFNTQVIALTHPMVFTFHDLRLQTDTGARVDFDIANNNIADNDPPDDETRAEARFFGAILTIHGNAAHPSCTTSTSELQIAFRLPVEANALAAHITAGLLRDPHVLLAVLAQELNQAPDVGILTRPNAQITVQNDHGLFRDRFLDYYHHCLFDVAVRLIRETFVGAQPPGTAHAAIQNCRQVYYDTTTRHLVINSVRTYYDEFTTTLLAMPTDRRYTVDIAHIFFANLERSLQQLFLSRGHEVVPQPANEDNAAAQARVHDIFLLVLGLEEEMDAIQRRTQAPRPLYPNRNPTPHAFLTTLNQIDIPTVDFVEAYTEMEYQGLPVEETALATTSPPSDEPDMERLYDLAYVHLSVAEEAIRRASGPTMAPKECWGCTDTQFHKDRFHLFRDCPNQRHPDVRKNFERRLAAFRQNKSTNPYQPARSYQPTTTSKIATTTIDPGNWESDGWPNKESAIIVAQLCDTSTTPDLRRVLLPAFLTAASHGSVGNQTNKRPALFHTTDIEHPPGRSNRGDEEDADDYYGPGSKPAKFFSYMITIPDDAPPVPAIHHFQATLQPTVGAPPLAFSQVLPHICFPIGKRTGDNQNTLRCMLDSGASLNVGRTEYHASIYKLRPELVHSFAYLKDIDGMKEFTIGSVNGDGPATVIDAAITYKTPYILQGRPVVVTFALGPTIATNSILSFPFLQSIKATIMFENNTCVSGALGDSFKIDPMVPLQADRAPIIPLESPAAFQSHTRPFYPTPRAVDMLQRIPNPWQAMHPTWNMMDRAALTPIYPTPTLLPVHHASVRDLSPDSVTTIETYLLHAAPNQS